MESSYDKTPINSPAIELPIAKYTEEDLQRILKTVLKARVPLSNTPRKKLLKARSPDVYHGKSHMEYYNFCQQYEDHFAIARAKGPNHIPFTALILYGHINFH